MSAAGNIEDSAIVLGDGTLFEGEAIGFGPDGGVTTGEFVFNTVLSGYQEVISDPSYAGQIITFTYPHIGNYGVNAHDDESLRPRCSGVVIRDLRNPRRGRVSMVEQGATYWHMVDLLWVVIFALLYVMR